MKVLVVGTGSIGTRHINNLNTLGHEVYAVDINPEKLVKVSPLVLGRFSTLKQGLKINPDVAFICTFSNSHVVLALECAKAGSHLFIEKPLSTNMLGIKMLLKVVEEKKLVSMVGCNMRFHPAIVYMHSLLNKNLDFKKPLLADLEFGYYLPFAKPDYIKGYQAHRKMGGNLIFDGIHELDYAVWFFGVPRRVFCNKDMRSNLKMNTEDHVEMIIEFESGLVCSVRLDYLQHGYSRRCKIVTEKATAVWDFMEKKIGVITQKQRIWKLVDMDVELYYNKMYVDEVKYFLDSVKTGRKTFNSVWDATVVTKLGIAADRSSQSGKWECVPGGM